MTKPARQTITFWEASRRLKVRAYCIKKSCKFSITFYLS